jgi:hypothetical protein
MNTKESILASFDTTDPDKCWLWPTSLNQYGYGRVRFNGKQWSIHRLMYEWFVGPIPPGLEIDHACHDSDCPGGGRGVCDHRRCGNPSHLRAVPPGDNKRRRAVSGPPREVKTHCINNHEFTRENSGYTNKGRRFCRICRTETKKRYNLRRKAEVAP